MRIVASVKKIISEIGSLRIAAEVQAFLKSATNERRHILAQSQ